MGNASKISMVLTVEIYYNIIEVPDVWQKWGTFQYDGVTLNNYLRIYEDIAVYK